MPVDKTIQLRRGTANQWTTANPILAAGEAGYETDTKKLKYGDGTSNWTSLPYFNPQTISLTGDVTGSGTGSFTATLANSGATAGSYSGADITIDAKGRVTGATNGRRVVNAGNTTGSYTIDLSLANDTYLFLTLTGNVTLTISNAAIGKTLYIRAQQGGSGSYTITFPGAVTFGSTPSWNTTVGKINTFAMVAYSSTVIEANSTKYP